jgi:hypothetical protein
MGVGLGFTLMRLYQWQSEIFRRQQTQQRLVLDFEG